jgi:hypothetical protein
MATRRPLSRSTSTRVLVALGLVAVPAGTALATAGHGTTVVRTIGDANDDNRLAYLAGDRHVTRTDLAAARSGRQDRRVARIFFGQQTDLHVIDEESPLRVEFVDRLGPPLTSAYRPQEGCPRTGWSRWPVSCAPSGAPSRRAGSTPS